MSSVKFISLGFIRQQPTLEPASSPSAPSAHAKCAIGSILRRTHSDPMCSLPAMDSDWSDTHRARPSLSAQPAAFAAAPAAPIDQDVVLVSTLLLDHKITNLEERLKTAMGPWALYGLRYSTLVGLAAAGTTKVALVVLAGAVTLSPMVGLGLFLGLVVGSIAVGVLAQTIARRKFAKTGQSAAFMQEILALQEDLLQQERLSGTQTKSLRRLQIMSAQMRGGFRQSVWSVFYGITGFDPELPRMMRRAHDAPAMPPEGATAEDLHPCPKGLFSKMFAPKRPGQATQQGPVSGSGVAEK